MKFALPPGVKVLKGYQRTWLRSDIVAGIILTTLLVPQGMAYAELAGLPSITGLYTSVLCLLGYAAFGPSRVLVLGPDSSLGPMIAATIIPIVGSNGDPARAVELASMLAVMVGAIMIIAGVFKLGFVADLLSKPTKLGYMNGLALTILIGQLPKLFGFSTDASGLLGEIGAFIHGLYSGEFVGAAVIIGISSLALIFLLGKFMPKIPAVLVAVVGATILSSVLHLSQHGVSVVGVLPKGFPPFTLPHISDFPLLLAGAASIAVVALTDTISVASAFAGKKGKEIDGNGEMVGVGVASVAAGFFQGFPVSTSGSRTAVAEQSGAKTQLTGIVGAVLIVLMLVFIPGLLRNLPNPTLAAVVIAASMSLADIPASMKLYKQRRSEFVTTLVAFLGVALLGVLPGIGIAIALSIFNVFRRLWWPYQTTLGKVKNYPGYHDVQQYPDGELLPGLVIYRFDAPLIFANARTFRDQIKLVAASRPKPKYILIAAEPITDIDATAADMLRDLDKSMNAKNISLEFAELKHRVHAKFEKFGLIGDLEPHHFYPTLDAAIADYQKKTKTKWQSPAMKKSSAKKPASKKKKSSRK
ncbi:MAG TPA: sulfate permease [Candidatus Saccharimonadales bacterium]|nr:sulfate permease [Candidatus Saccharimonadales bacterium]